MANVKINDLAVIADPASTDVLPIVDVTLDTTNKISIADILKTAPDGSFSAPSIAFEGDSNTGIFHPGSEQIGFTTSGSEALRIASDGNVGIGTSAPVTELQLTSDPGPTLTLDTFGNTAGELIGAINFNNRTSAPSDEVLAYVKAELTSTRRRGSLQLGTGSSGPATTKLYIDSDGNVGIGTTSPDTVLDIRDGAFGNNQDIGIQVGVPTGEFKSGFKLKTNSSGVPRVAIEAASDSLGGSEEYLSITNLGNVGIGTTGPIYPLDVARGDTGAVVANITSATSAAYYTATSNTSSTNAVRWGASGDEAIFWAGSSEKMRIDSSGNVGIGTTDPQEKLHVRAGNSGDAAPAIGGVDGAIIETAANRGGGLVFSTPNDQTAGVFFKDPDSTSAQGAVRYQHEDDQMNFLVNGSERLRIDSAGNVGIGTVSPVEKLDISNGILRVSNNTTPSNENDNAAYFGKIDGNAILSHSTAVAFRVNANERLRIDSDGNVGIGTSAPGAKLDIRGSAGTEVRIDLNEGTTTNPLRIEQNATEGRIQTTASQPLILAGQSGAGSTSDIRLETRDQERMRITSDGNVGIGTSTPGKNLDILGSNNSNSTIRLLSNQPSGTASNTIIAIGDSGKTNQAGGLRYAITAGGEASLGLSALSTAAADRQIVILDTGNVGIGTTDPVEKLSVVGDESGITVASTNQEANYYHIFRQNSGGALIFSGEQESFSKYDFRVFPTNGVKDTTALFIQNNGKVGIGTTAPAVKLEINGSTGIPRTVGGYTFREIVGGNVRAGIYSDTDNPLIFRTGGDNEAARIDNDGRLLLGTTSDLDSGGLLQIKSTSPASAATLYREVDDTAGMRLNFAKSRGSTTAIVNNNDSLGVIRFIGCDGTDVFSQAAAIESFVDGTPGADDMPGRLVFSTTADGASSPTERMRITNEGRVLIGTTAQFGDGGLTLRPNVAAGSGQIYFTRASNASSSFCVIFNSNDIDVGSISYTNSGASFNTTSDYRLKENVVPLTGAADRVNQLQVHRFNFIADPDTTVDGFIAHEAQAVVPECVTGTKDEVDDEGNPVYQGIDQSKIVPLLTAALQEALAKIETLEQRLNDAGL